MRCLGYVAGISCLLISSVAHTEDAIHDNPSLKISPPAGFCELDKAIRPDAALSDGMSGYAKVSGFSLVALYPDCHELKESRTSGAFIRTKIAFAKFVKRVDGPPSRYISETCDALRRGLSDEQRARISKYVTEFSKGNNSLQGALPLGVLDEDRGAVCYSGQLIKGKVANASEITLVYLTAATIVGDQPISISQWTNYIDATSIATALTNLKTIYSDFRNMNGKTD
ncbi:hypothetical protein JQ616_29945 [Bradyrhizobium tropiciagri]|uniref:hypothetical protein n=1 Tax=Bradyrhizobium tropiciagri TaxID=312253 RepID=UPI001BA85AEE|nr:hypothetical protein [Bradyrhizobium tropiciagri]MBR0899193.1 hypothetical protein [Bradyrhizobium tropiciagri]